MFRNSGEINVPDSSFLKLRRFTLAAWISMVRFRSSSRLMAKGNSYHLFLFGSRPHVGFHDGKDFHQLTAPTGLSPRSWNLVAGTFDGAAMKLYVDGVITAEKAETATPSQTDEPLTIGGEAFDGLLDDIRVYQRALSAQEIESLYRNGPRAGFNSKR
jgi:Concanavalin A-like lectin/glucanases superfamily